MRLSSGAKAVLPPGGTALTDRAQRTFAEFWLSWVDQHRRFLLLAITVLYLAGFNAQWRVDPDSALYLSIGRNLAEGHGYTYQDVPHRGVYPGLPLLAAGVFKIFETETLWPLHVVMLLMAAAALALTYRLFRVHADRPTAVLMVCGVALNKSFYRQSFLLLTDMPFLVGVMAFLAGYEAICERACPRGCTMPVQGHLPQLQPVAEEPSSPHASPANSPRRAGAMDWVLLLGGLALAMTMRPAIWALLLAVVADTAWRTVTGRMPRRRLLVIVLVAAVAALWLIFDPRRGSGQQAVDGYEQHVLSQLRHLGPTLHGLLFEKLPKLIEGGEAAAAVFGLKPGIGLNSLLGLTALILGVAVIRHRTFWGLWVLITLIMIAVIQVVDRYFLAILPLLVFGWWRGACYLNRRLPRRWGNAACILVLLLLNGPNTSKIVEMIWEQRQMPFLAYYKEGRYPPLKAIAAQLAEHVEPQALVLASGKASRVLSYWSRRHVVQAVNAPNLNPMHTPVYVVRDPADAELEIFLEEHDIQVGPALCSIARARGLPPLTLHRALFPPPPPPSTAGKHIGNGI